MRQSAKLLASIKTKSITQFSPSVSIILPFKDAEETVLDCIRSIKAQTFDYWELIAVNDSSIDGSLQKVTLSAQNDTRIKIYNNKGKGIVDALNTAIWLSVGKFIARMDADDTMHKERLSLQFDFLRNNKDIGLVSSLVTHKGNEKDDFRGYQNYVNWINNLIDPEEISKNRFIESPIAHPSVMFRKELLSLFGNYQKGEFPEDYELWLRFLDKGVKMTKINRHLLTWNDAPNRLSRKDHRYKLHAFQKIKAQYVAKWIAKRVPPRTAIHVWGYGKIARRQARFLRQFGLNIKIAYEVDSQKFRLNEDGTKVIHYERVPAPGTVFILVLIGSGDIRSKITQYLTDRGYLDGENYLFLA